MFVEHHAIEPQLVTVNLFIEILVEQLRTLLGVEKSIGHAEEAAPLEHLIFRHGVIRPLSEKHYVHMVASSTGFTTPLSSPFTAAPASRNSGLIAHAARRLLMPQRSGNSFWSGTGRSHISVEFRSSSSAPLAWRR